MTITRQMVLDAASSNCGWNNDQLRLMKVRLPLHHGWIETLVGTEVDEETWHKVMALSGIRKKRKRNEIISGQDFLL